MWNTNLHAVSRRFHYPPRTQMFSLAGKTAIVTGASRGIGRAIAEILAMAGATVFFCGREDDLGKTVADGINSAGGSAHFSPVDITSPDAARQFVEAAGTATGRIDVLCNNASYTTGSQHEVISATDEEWERNIAVGIMGMHYCTQAALPWMIKGGGGSVIVISSIQALAACASSAPYTTVKAAQLGFVLSAACDYGKHNIRVNAICPGPIQVGYSPKPGSPGYQYQVDSTLLGRVGQPAEIAHAALYLASDEASFVTGITMPVDGGWTAK
jgi:NAD(P)-dependent dehydrogenase (short-subunit alcohol dehydrogenase family)